MRRIDGLLYTVHPFYGSCQMSRHLQREDHRVGRDKVRRLMCKIGLDAVYCKPHASQLNLDPQHRVYPYLLRNLAIERPQHV